MRILLLTQYYPPESGAAQNRLQSFVRSCHQRGVAVTVLTALPNYPEGRVREKYRGRWMVRETIDGTDIIRAWIWPRPGSGLIGRGIMYLSFAFAALVVGLLHAPSCDVLIWESPPLVLGPTAFLLARIKGARLATNVSDLWTASLLGLGLMPEGVLARAMLAMERYLYRSSAVVTGQTQHIVDDIRSHAGKADVVLWRNGTDIGEAAKENIAATREEWGIKPGQFVAGYAGVFGLSQGLEVICQAAALIQSPEVKIVMVGDGPEKLRVQSLAQEMGLTNILFLPRQPHASMPSIWGAFDCAIVCLKRRPVFKGAVPSKMFEAMYARRPIVLGVEGEAAGILTEAGAGVVVEPENAVALAKAIDELCIDPERRSEFGENGRRTAARDFNRSSLNDKVIDRLIATAEDKP